MSGNLIRPAAGAAHHAGNCLLFNGVGRSRVRRALHVGQCLFTGTGAARTDRAHGRGGECASGHHREAPSGAGTIAGGVVGGVAGSNVGGGKGAIIGSVLGAVAGGVAGQAIESGIGRTAGLEITVKLDNGELRAITQDADESFKPGERVRLLSGSGVTRVTR